MNEAKEKIQELVEKYESVKASGKIKKYTEEETKKDFILPLFHILGWNVYDKEEVSAEEHIISSGRVDYGFYINGRVKFYLEAKPLRVDIHREEFANQAIKYSWNKGVTWAILTDFESVKVFNAQAISKFLSDKLYFEIKYDEYLKRFDQLWQLSKASFGKDLIDVEAERAGKKLQKIPVGELLFKDLNESRNILTNSLDSWNQHKIPKDLLDEGVQRLLDRLIFIRVAEDRKIEENILAPLINQWRSTTGKNKPKIYESMIHKFRELDKIYNSNLFTDHPFERWEDDGADIEKVINILKGKKGYYEYDFSVLPADVLGSVYENYLGYKLAQSQKGLALDKSASKRKEQGIYYTPVFIVDYIVRNALKPVLDKCTSINDLKKIKVLDPACGSGSFLIKVLEIINEKYKEFGNVGDELTKIQILQENIYGVDLDEQAVEIARLNLLINALEKRAKLPLLDKNIINRNSLISGTDEELRKFFGNNYKDKKPINWKEEFPEVFKQGGFDVIIGNPPWVTLRHNEIGSNLVSYYKANYEGAKGFKLNLFPLFTEQSLALLKQKGILSFILPNRLFDTPSYKGVREKFIGRLKILDIQNLPSGGFSNVVAGNIIITIQNVKEDSRVISISNFNTKKILKIPIEKIVSNPNLTININLDPDGTQVISAIQQNKTLELKEICNIHVGMMIRNKKDKFNLNKSKYKIVTGKDLGRYSVINRNNFNPAEIEVFGGTKNPNKHLESPKLLVRKTGNRILCSLDIEGIFAEQSVYLILLRNKKFNLKFLAALLNSKLITFYFQNELITNPEAYPYIQHYDLERIPIVDVEEKQQKKLVDLVSEIINLNQRLISSPVNSNRWDSLKAEIEKIDKKIDEEVYKLYGLAPEEIAVVEGRNES